MIFEELNLKLEKYLKESDLKMTQERHMILKISWKIGRAVCGRGHCSRCGDCKGGSRHFSVDDIHTILKNKKFILSQSTVYRTLQLFCKAGIIRFAFKRNGKTTYELNIDEAHDHLICVRCNKVIEFIVPETDDLHKKLCDKYGFSEVDHIHCIRGVCKKCKSKSS